MKRFSPVVPVILILLILGVVAVTASIDSGSTADTATAELAASSTEEAHGTTFVSTSRPEISLMRWLAALTVVLAVLGGLYFILRKFSSGQGPRTGKRLIRVIESHILGPRRALCAVKVMDRVLILGVTDSSISLLSEIEERSWMECLEPRGEDRESSAARRFSSYLGTMLKLNQGETADTSGEVA